MEKFARFMEKFWLALAAITAIWAIYMLAVHGWSEGAMWLWFPLVCVAMWWYRRFTRRKMAEWAERQRQG
jgi:hypothetical protein